jgi:hypothetical protein
VAVQVSGGKQQRITDTAVRLPSADECSSDCSGREAAGSINHSLSEWM